MNIKKLLCFGLAAAVVSANIPTMAVQAQEVQTEEYQEEIMVAEADVHADTKEFQIEDGVLVKYTGTGKDVVIPDSVTSIGEYAFQSCSGLTSITIPSSVTSISKGAFAGCSSFTSITIPNSVTNIGPYAFSDCSNLKNITISNSITSIEEGVFWGCSSLTSVTIPESVTSIKRSAFAGCDKLVNVIIPGSVTNIVNNAFSGSNSKLVIYGESGSAAEEYAQNRKYTFRLISEKDLPETNITCKKKTYKVTYGTKPFNINATSNSSLTYTSSANNIATVGKTSGRVTIKGCGVAVITIKSGKTSVNITVKVNPKKQSVKSLKAVKGKKLTVKWKKDKTVTGYQIQLSTTKNFKKIAKKQTVSKNTKDSYTFTKLKAGKKYYVRVRSYKKSGKTTQYGGWSNVKHSKSIIK